MDREHIRNWWDAVYNDGLWHASWSRALDGLTAAQAAWTPAPGRLSIWTIVNHCAFWREHELRKLAGEAVSEDEINRRNMAAPETVTESAWQAARQNLADTQEKLAAAIARPDTDLSRISHLIPHDSYHLGQVMYLRALQGFPPIA